MELIKEKVLDFIIKCLEWVPDWLFYSDYFLLVLFITGFALLSILLGSVVYYFWKVEREIKENMVKPDYLTTIGRG